MIPFIPSPAVIAAAFPIQPGILDSYLGWSNWQTSLGITKLRSADIDEFAIVYLAEFIAPLGDHLHEIRGTLEFENDKEARAVHSRIRVLRKAHDRTRRQTGIGKSRAKSSLAEIQKKVLPIDLRYLTETEADPVNGEEYLEIEGGHWWRVREMKTDSMRLEAAVCALVYRSFYPFLPLSAILAECERHEDLFLEAGEDATDPEAVGRVYDAYMIQKTLFSTDSDSRRAMTYRGLQRRHSMLANYAAARPGHAPAIRKLLPVLPDKDCAVHKRIVAANSELNDIQQKNAKDRADPLSDDFDDMLSAMRVRQRQSLRMQRECERIRRIMRKRGADGAFVHGDAVEFAYQERVVTPDGRRLECSQRVHMIARRANTVLPKCNPSEIVFQFLHVEDDGEERYKPWFIPLFECGALLAPSRLTLEMREQRRRMVIDLEVPDLHDKPAGMVSSDGRAGANLLEAGLKLGMVLIAIDEFAHAMLMSYIMVRVLAITMCRIGEAIQMTFEPSRWVLLNIDGRSINAFLAIPKGWDEDDQLPLDDKTVVLLGRLAKLTREREGGTAIVPSKSSFVLPQFKQRVAPHVFGFRGRAMSEGDLNYLFRILCLGLGNFTSHAVRHASANAANLERIEMEYIKHMLRQRGKGTASARHYAAKTEAQKAEAYERARKRRLELEALGPATRELEIADG